MAEKRSRKSPSAIPDADEFAALGTVIGRLIGNAVITQLRLEALRDVIADDSALKTQYSARYKELRADKRDQLRDKLLLTAAAYDRRYPDEKPTSVSHEVANATTMRKRKASTKKLG